MICYYYNYIHLHTHTKEKEKSIYITYLYQKPLCTPSMDKVLHRHRFDKTLYNSCYDDYFRKPSRRIIYLSGL